MTKVNLELDMTTQDMTDTDGNQFICSDYKDTPGLLEGINSLLQSYNLELLEGDAGDDNNWVAIVRNENFHSQEAKIKELIDKNRILESKLKRYRNKTRS